MSLCHTRDAHHISSTSVQRFLDNIGKRRISIFLKIESKHVHSCKSGKELQSRALNMLDIFKQPYSMGSHSSGCSVQILFYVGERNDVCLRLETGQYIREAGCLSALFGSRILGHTQSLAPCHCCTATHTHLAHRMPPKKPHTNDQLVSFALQLNRTFKV